VRTELPEDQVPGVYRRRVGEFVVTALSDGYLVLDRVMTRNLPPEELAGALRAAFLDELAFSVNCFLVQSPSYTALIETGSGHYLGDTAGRLAGNLALTGVTPADIDAVLLTHMHPDHSSGLTDPQTGALNFPNAELVVHANEPKHWFDDAELARASELYKYLHFQMTREQVTGYLGRMRTFTGGEVLPGIQAVPCPGHTPGHTSFVIGSGSDHLIIWGDTIHLPEVQFARPEITMVPDLDPQAAVASRRRILEMTAAEGFLASGMHMHFPGFSHVTRESGAFGSVPAPWKLHL
jgi:glyoxylase-like metal-dependent hydrolase (beta-lactamase superfamily II)